ncbi:MAG TPA: metallophosphoesterase [Gaiellaceae bacterium]|nr:metallophosphoesterase [Gaiellaceae bacterium]
MRIGVLSDLHCELEPAGSRWINVFEPEHLDERTDAALAWFAEVRVDLILVLGDVVQFANLSDLEHMFSRLATASAPVATVGGNHDLRLGDDFAHAAREHGIRLLDQEPLDAVTGVGVARGPAPPQYVGRLGSWPGDADLVIVASHFPLLSEATKVAAAGLPYAGDLVNRGELEGRLRSDGGPKLVLSGHIHARCSTHEGALLQLTVGALIEPPFDATLVEIDGTGVRRTARRLGEPALTDPVFAPEDENWLWSGDRWARA